VTDPGAALQSVETYKVSRTTLAKLKAGKF
jgi:hypothetical protein